MTRTGSDFDDAMEILDSMTREELVQTLLEKCVELRAYQGQVRGVETIMNDRQDCIDELKRRLDLAHAITDHVTQRTLSIAQLEKIAAVIWPAGMYAVDIESDPHGEKPGIAIVDISAPTRVADPDHTLDTLSAVAAQAMLVTASGLLWNAHYVIKQIEEMGGGTGRVVLGDMLSRAIVKWRDNVNAWRHACGVEQVEVAELTGKTYAPDGKATEL